MPAEEPELPVIVALLYTVLCVPGLFAWWLLHHRLEPRLSWAIPAPRRPELMVDLEINPLFNDWRGFT